MEQKFTKYIDLFSKELIERYGFGIKHEVNYGQSYMIEFSSIDFVINIEKYFREFYISLYKVSDPDNGINLFNLLEYLKQDVSDVPKAEYFRKVGDVDECFRKQFEHISTVFYENYSSLRDFFSDHDYEVNIAEFKRYWKNRHPELY